MLAGLAIVVAGVGVTTAGPAAAAPTGANDAGLTPVTLVCGGVTYQTVTKGQGRFTPAHDVATNAVLVPSQFGAATIVVTDPEGNVLDSFTTRPSRPGAAASDGSRVSSTAPMP